MEANRISRERNSKIVSLFMNRINRHNLRNFLKFHVHSLCFILNIKLFIPGAHERKEVSKTCNSAIRSICRQITFQVNETRKSCLHSWAASIVVNCLRFILKTICFMCPGHRTASPMTHKSP